MPTFPPSRLPHIIDATMLSSFHNCPTQFWRGYGMRRRGEHFIPGTPVSSKPSIHLTAGGAFSSGLEAYRVAYYGERAGHEEAMHRAVLAATIRWGDDLPPFPTEFGKDHLIEAKNLANMIFAIQSYVAHYHPDRDDFQPEPTSIQGTTTFEFSFMIPLDADIFPAHPDDGEPFILAGRLDGKGTYRGIPTFSDEKTTKGIGPSWPTQWALRNQFLCYGWALRHLGFPHRHGLARGVAILKESIKFSEFHCSYPDFLLDRWERELVRDLFDMCHYYTSKDWPLRFGEACTHFSGCEFRDVCLSNPNSQPGILATYGFNDWEPGRPHPQAHVVDLYKGELAA